MLSAIISGSPTHEFSIVIREIYMTGYSECSDIFLFLQMGDLSRTTHMLEERKSVSF